MSKGYYVEQINQRKLCLGLGHRGNLFNNNDDNSVVYHPDFTHQKVEPKRRKTVHRKTLKDDSSFSLVSEPKSTLVSVWIGCDPILINEFSYGIMPQPQMFRAK